MNVNLNEKWNKTHPVLPLNKEEGQGKLSKRAE
jgi:hypothetical protein